MTKKILATAITSAAVATLITKLIDNYCQQGDEEVSDAYLMKFTFDVEVFTSTARITVIGSKFDDPDTEIVYLDPVIVDAHKGSIDELLDIFTRVWVVHHDDLEAYPETIFKYMDNLIENEDIGWVTDSYNFVALIKNNNIMEINFIG